MNKLTWQERLIKALGGFTETEVKIAEETAFSNGSLLGQDEAQVLAQDSLEEILDAVRSVLELNDLNPRTLLKKVRDHMKTAAKIKKQKMREADKLAKQVSLLRQDVETAAATEEATAEVLDVLAKVPLRSNQDFALPK